MKMKIEIDNNNGRYTANNVSPKYRIIGTGNSMEEAKSDFCKEISKLAEEQLRRKRDGWTRECSRCTNLSTKQKNWYET